MSQLALDGELIKLKNCKVELTMQLADQDMSGQSSSTSSSEQGDKAKEIKISGIIPFTDSAQLSRLFTMASTKDDAGNRKIWRVGSTSARVAQIRQAKFFGQITAPEHPTFMAWNVSFQLRECLSVAELAEQRESSEPQSDTQTIPTAALSDTQPTIEASYQDKVLAGVDAAISGRATA